MKKRSYECGLRSGSYECLRSGHWNYEEEQYASLIIKHFVQGEIPGLQEGVTLRTVVATLLNCHAMRVSKKFAKDKALGKVEYVPSDKIGNVDELRQAEKNFHKSVAGLKCAIFDGSLHHHLYRPPPPKRVRYMPLYYPPYPYYHPYY